MAKAAVYMSTLKVHLLYVWELRVLNVRDYCISNEHNHTCVRSDNDAKPT